MQSNETSRFTNVSRTLCLAVIVVQMSGRALASYPTTIDDTADLFSRGSAALGLPSWRVSEPFISLWVQYPAIRYTTSAGKAINLDVVYRQRGGVNNSNVFGFGP